MMTPPELDHDSRDFVYVPVPTEHVLDVLAYIARLAVDGARSPVSPEAPRTASPVDDRVEGWSDSELAALVGLPNKVSKTIQDVLIVLDNAEGPLSTRELAEQTGRDYGQLKNLPTSFSRVMNARFPEHPTPWVPQWGTQLNPPRKAELYFHMTPERSAQWRRISASIR